jgi:uncharacterized membrane protein (DUF441 family)
MRTLVGLFLVAHGAVTALMWIAPKPEVVEGQVQPPDPSHSWLFGDVRAISITLGLIVWAALALAGVAFLAHQPWWPPAAIAAGVASLALFVVFFTPWWVAGIGISAPLVVGALRAIPA